MADDCPYWDEEALDCRLNKKSFRVFGRGHYLSLLSLFREKQKREKELKEAFPDLFKEKEKPEFRAIIKPWMEG